MVVLWLENGLTNFFNIQLFSKNVAFVVHSFTTQIASQTGYNNVVFIMAKIIIYPI